MSSDYTPMDDALESLAEYGWESPNAGGNHAPMVVEALCATGRAREVSKWLPRYVARLTARHGRRGSISGDWCQSLGDGSRFTDWADFFEQALAERDWREVLNEWVLRLAPGSAAAFGHGLLRTAHAVRAMSREVTPIRRRELADGLAYWAGRYMSLPEEPNSPGPMMPYEAIRTMPTMTGQRARNGIEGLLATHGFPPFRNVINLVETSADPSTFLSDITRSAAESFVENENGFEAAVAFLHSVTIPASVRLILPYLTPEVTKVALRYCWQVTSALYCAFGPTRRHVGDDKPIIVPEDLLDEAVQTGIATTDPHVIKFAEACIREYELTQTGVYLAAAEHGIKLLSEQPT